jgi:hypothetical protein
MVGIEYRAGPLATGAVIGRCGRYNRQDQQNQGQEPTQECCHPLSRQGLAAFVEGVLMLISRSLHGSLSHLASAVGSLGVRHV